jgi:D-3-phosphoglycerate dehydrogenase
MRAVFLDASPFMASCYDEALRAAFPGLVVHEGRPDDAAFVERASRAEALLVFQTKMTDAMMARCPRLRAVSVLSTGYAGWVDVEAAGRRGVRVTGVRGYADRAVAEHALALLLSCTRRIAAMDRALRAGRWAPEAVGELAGRTVAVIGLGGTGRAFAALARALGMDVIAWNRTQLAVEGARLLPLDEALAAADVVSLHLAATPDTSGILDSRRLDLLGHGAILINTARGALVDEPALIERLADGRIAAAGLDVFAEEPLPAGHPLTRLDNVVLTAHAAWLGPEAGKRLLRRGLENLRSQA